MNRFLKEVLTGIGLAIVVFSIFASLLWIISGCRMEAAEPRPLIPSATIEDFKAAPVRPILVRTPLEAAVLPPPPPIRIVVGPVKWELAIVSLPTLQQVPFLILTSTPPRLKWQGKPGKYRIIVSDDGIICRESVMIDVFVRYGWTEHPVDVPVPTNRFYWLVTAK